MSAPAGRAAKLLRLLAGHHEFRYDRLSFPRRPTARQRLNLLASRLESRLRARRPLSYPVALQLEPTIRCQLDCPLCPRRLATEGRPGDHMAWDDYVRLLAEVGPHLLAIAFWQWGEPLLHPRLPEMIDLASRRRILCLLSTNGQTRLERGRLRDLVRSGVDLLIVSIDGASQGSYESFRRGGRLELAREFVRRVVAERTSLGRARPLVNVRAIATRASEPDLPLVRRLARRDGADLFSVKSVSLYYDDDPGSPELPQATALRSYQYQGRRQAARYRELPNLCVKPWAWPTLRHDGTLLLCECDHGGEHPLGNAFGAGGFRAVWRGEAARALRRAFPADGLVGLEFCRRCRYKRDDAIRRLEWCRGRAGA